MSLYENRNPFTRMSDQHVDKDRKYTSMDLQVGEVPVGSKQSQLLEGQQTHYSDRNVDLGCFSHFSNLHHQYQTI